MATVQKKGMQLPDAASFERIVTPKDSGEIPGSVIGLDYEQWASAYVDLDEREDRIIAARNRLLAKGYQLAPGAEIAGAAHVEVYVLPRAIYREQAEAHRLAVRKAVRDGKLTNSATDRPAIDHNGF